MARPVLRARAARTAEVATAEAVAEVATAEAVARAASRTRPMSTPRRRTASGEMSDRDGFPLGLALVLGGAVAALVLGVVLALIFGPPEIIYPSPDA